MKKENALKSICHILYTMRIKHSLWRRKPNEQQKSYYGIDINGTTMCFDKDGNVLGTLSEKGAFEELDGVAAVTQRARAFPCKEEDGGSNPSCSSKDDCLCSAH